MTVKELIDILEEMPKDKQIAVRKNSQMYGASSSNDAAVYDDSGKYVWIVDKNDVALLKYRKLCRELEESIR